MSCEADIDATNEGAGEETQVEDSSRTAEESAQAEVNSSEPENTQQASTRNSETSIDDVQSPNNTVTTEENDKPITTEIESDKPVTMEVENDKPVMMEVENDKSVTMEVENDKPVTMETENDKPVTMEVQSDKPATIEAENVQEMTANDSSMDFTADISLDQFTSQKEITDEDVMQHLDVIENIDLIPGGFDVSQNIDQAIKLESSQNNEEEQNKEQDEITILDEETLEEQWYREKLEHKDMLLKHRMSKLARVLMMSYPHYKKWLERMEKVEGTPICRIDPPRPCSTNKLHGNRWRFACNEKFLDEPQNKDNPNSSSNKNDKVPVWRVELVPGSSTEEVPPFVLYAVKIFEDFLQTTIKSFQGNSDEVSIIEIKKEKDEPEEKQEWMWLLVRCNSIDDLMLFATGRNISRSTMDRLKQTYEHGPGKSCNVKSFYCKSMNKCDNKVNVVTTFLVGAEALEEAVGDLKLQLAPKTNFFPSAAGAWNLVKTVKDMLKPTTKATLLEIGCGIGVIGLSLASQCREVIGVDTPSEVEEAEMTSELNRIFNVSYIVGTPAEVVAKLNSARDLHNKSRTTFCIINTNTIMGRAIEVMTCLRKLTSLRRIVMITTMTKQSVRALLELARPIEGGLGHPFMPIRACAVDMLPNASYFESVILMERRLMHRLTQPWFIQMLEEESKSLDNNSALERIIINEEKNDNVDLQLRKNPLAKFEAERQSGNKTSPAKAGGGIPARGKAKLKRDHSPDVIELSGKMTKKFEKSGPKWKPAKKKNWNQGNSSLCINPLFEKKVRIDSKEQVDLREKLSSNRTEVDLIQKVNESRKILEAAKEQLSGPSPKVDATTAKELKNVLSLVLDQTPRSAASSSSVWDRIAPPPEGEYKAQRKKDLDNDPLLKDRFVHETCAQDILITMPNKEYLETDPSPKPKPTRYRNLPPLEPDVVVPLNTAANRQSSSPRGSFSSRGRQQGQNNWNKNKRGFDRNRVWNNATRRTNDTPLRNRMSSPSREYLAPPEDSPPRRHFSPDREYQAHESYREYSPQKRSMSPPRHAQSGGRRQMTPPRRQMTPPPRRQMTPPPRRQMTPPRRPYSPPRTMSPPRRSMMDAGRAMSPIRPQKMAISPPRRQLSPEMKYDPSSARSGWQSMSPPRRQMSPERRRPVSPVGRMSPPRQRDMMPPRRQTPPRLQFPSHQVPLGRPALSPPRQQSPPPRHQSAPSNRFADDWDIPSRGAFEQGGSVWQRSVDERQPAAASGNWQQPTGDERYRKPANQDNKRPWARDPPSHELAGTRGNSWSGKPSLANPGMKEPWQSSDSRWSAPSGTGSSNENWNRSKDIVGGRKEIWLDSTDKRWEQMSGDPWNQKDSEDWNDLPEDARDPWGDEDNAGSNERWTNDQPMSGSTWMRETETVEPWARPPKDWQNKSQGFTAKMPGQNATGNKMNDSRWLPQRESFVSNDMNKKAPSNWQGNANVGSNNWQSQNYGQSQAQRFVSNIFKNRR